MKALVTTEFPGRPDNEVLSRTIIPGEELTGDLAEVAVKAGWAKPVDEKAAPGASKAKSKK